MLARFSAALARLVETLPITLGMLMPKLELYPTPMLTPLEDEEVELVLVVGVKDEVDGTRDCKLLFSW